MMQIENETENLLCNDTRNNDTQFKSIKTKLNIYLSIKHVFVFVFRQTLAINCHVSMVINYNICFGLVPFFSAPYTHFFRGFKLQLGIILLIKSHKKNTSRDNTVMRINHVYSRMAL